MKDKQRSGRNCLISRSAVEHIKAKVLEGGCVEAFSAARLSALLQAGFGSHVSSRTVCRTLKGANWKYGHAKRELMLKPSHKQQRLAWAQKHLHKRTAFQSWMFTDSKVFLLHKTASKAGVKVWFPADCRPSSPVAKHSKGLHVYLGVTKFGITPLVFVTGGGSQKSEHINPKTGVEHTGVSAAEYQKDVLPVLIKHGNLLFASQGSWGSTWVMQQDNARPHTAASTKAMLHKVLPNRVELEWPALSPDLSWIENVWSWAERKLQTSYNSLRTIDELKAALVHIFGKVPREMLRKYAEGMPNRLNKVVQQGGGFIHQHVNMSFKRPRTEHAG